jgi:hypothetical protein
MGRRAPARAGMAVRQATASRVPETITTSHQDGGLPCGPAFWTALYSSVPAGMPSSTPTSAGSSCAADSPATV